MTTWYTPEEFSAGTNLPVVSPPEASTIQRGNRKLKRLSVDDGCKNNLRRSINFDSTSVPPIISGDLNAGSEKTGTFMSLRRLYDGKSRFPRIENMPHFHYDEIDLGTPIQVSLLKSSNSFSGKPSVEGFIVSVTCKEKSWNIRRNVENFTGLDRQIHRCLFDRKVSQLPCLVDILDDQQRTAEVEGILNEYLLRLSEITDNINFNCGPVLNWFELDNHGNHLLLTDESAINVPAVAAAHVIKRYTAQGADEISLEVGDIISIIDMPPVDESIWWRGKRGYEVGFFPSQCVEVIGEMANNHPIPHGPGKTTHMKPVAKKRGKLMSFLRLFLSSRPTRARLMQSGILKERTFGCDLGDHLAQTSRQVPLVLEACSAVIEEHGVIDGIYRLTGSTSTIQKIRLAFDSETPPDLNTEFYLRDVHCISALLKTYFRELPNPLLTFHLYDKFVSAINITEEEQRKIAIHHVIQQLPPPHFRTLEYLLRHLSRIASFSSQTGMHAKNLAIVWAPNLLSPRNPDYGNTALLEINIQAILVEFLIRNTEELFDMNAASKAIVSNPQYNTLQERGPHHGLSFDADAVAPGTLGLRLASISVSPATKLITLEEARARASSVPNKPPPRPPPPRSLNLKYSDTIKEEPRQELGEPYQPHTTRRPESEVSTFSNRSSRGIFNRTKSFPSTITKAQETDNGTFFFVSKENPIEDNVESPSSDIGDYNPVIHQESLRQAHSADNLSADTVPSRHARIRTIKQGGQPVPPTRRSNRAEIVSITQTESPKPKHRYSFTSGASNVFNKASSLKRGSAPITCEGSRERLPSAGAQIRRHPVLTSFKKVTSEHSVFYTDGRVSLDSSLQRRASTGSHSDETSHNSVTTEKRPLSVYDNRPVSVYDNVNQRDLPTQRYSSPVFNCKSIPEESRYSMPANTRTPPLPRSYKGSGPDERLAITGARLAQSSIL